MPKPTETFEMPARLLDSIGQYLLTRPFGEVFLLMQGLDQVRAVPPAPSNEAEPTLPLGDSA